MSASSKAAVTELPIIQQDDQLIISEGEQILISASLLHQRLQVSTRFNDWIQRRISEYGFEEGLDFRSNLSVRSNSFDYSNLSNQKKKGRGGDRRSVDYLLTFDTAKELSMIEKNAIGRSIRRYFIEVEKRYRDWIGFILPRLRMDKDLFGQRDGYIYVELLESCQLSLKSGSRSARVRKNPQEFWRNSRGELCVTERYGKTIITNAIARRLNIETRERRLDHAQYVNTLNQGGTSW